MNQLIEAENTPPKPIARKEPRCIPATQLLFPAVTLGAAVVACAISGPKVPPLLGE